MRRRSYHIQLDTDSGPPRMFRQTAAAGLLFAGFVLSGCVVTPQPLSESELALTASTNMARVAEEQEPVTRAISLYEAMARALKFNLDHRVEMMARALADAKLEAARADMLPSLVANAHKSLRSKHSYSYSKPPGGPRSANASTSAEASVFTKDISFSWNILDFGLSYVRAKQAANRAMLAEEQKRKVINRIIEDVRTAYWRAVSAQRLTTGLQRLEGRVERALANSRSLGESGFSSPVAALNFQRELIDIKQDIQRMLRELKTAKIQLAALMNLPPDYNYKLVIPKRRLSHLKIRIPGDEMMRLALQNRPEMRELAYQGRISEQEAEAALLELLPGIQLYAGSNFDSNNLLLDNNWISWGAKASWNVMKLFQYPARKAVTDAELYLNDQRSLAMTMAIMTQVSVARTRYHYLRKSAETAAQYNSVQHKLLKQLRASETSGAESEQALIREEMNALVASAEYDLAYSDLQNAFGAIYATIGVDPWGDHLDTASDVETLAASLQQVWRERGDVGG